MLSIPKNNLTSILECSMIVTTLHNGETNEVNQRYT
jgi:hypothetical protein